MRPIVHRFLLAAALCVSGLVATTACAQPMIHQSAPFQSLGQSYYEQNGVTWNFRGPGFFINNGTPLAIAPFGNPDPNAGLNTGIGFQRGPYSGNLGFSFNQGSSRTNVSTTPSVTTMDGVPGTITDQTSRPFVTSITPVVGGGFIMPMQAPRNEGAEQIRNYQYAQQVDLQNRMKAAQDAKQKKAYNDYLRGLEAEEEDDLKKARANYRRALQSATGQLRLEVMKRMRERRWLR